MEHPINAENGDSVFLLSLTFKDGRNSAGKHTTQKNKDLGHGLYYTIFYFFFSFSLRVRDYILKHITGHTIVI